VRIKDTGAHVQIGTVLSHIWTSGNSAIELGYSSIWGSRTGVSPNLYMSNNSYNDGSDRYTIDGYAVEYRQSDTGSHIWYNAASGLTGDAITFTESMRINASRNVLVGTSTDTYGKFQVLGNVMFGNSSANSFYTTDGTINGRYGQNSDSAIWINNLGYANGSTQFRDLVIGDGKTNEIARFDGSQKSLNMASGAILNTAASTTAMASLNIPSGTAPTSPTNGDIWSDGSDLKVRLGGTTYTLTKS
jgi:hypothetical protein